MTWNEKMTIAMEMIEKACRENGNWAECEKCPFNKYCYILLKEKAINSWGGLTFKKA